MSKNNKEKIQRELIEFARKQIEIYAIYEGVEPEEETDVYYFLINKRLNPETEDKISELELRLFNEQGMEQTILEWPIPEESITKYPYLKKCIWKRV
jgi:hypothetical protein